MPNLYQTCEKVKRGKNSAWVVYIFLSGWVTKIL